MQFRKPKDFYFHCFSQGNLIINNKGRTHVYADNRIYTSIIMLSNSMEGKICSVEQIYQVVNRAAVYHRHNLPDRAEEEAETSEEGIEEAAVVAEDYSDETHTSRYVTHNLPATLEVDSRIRSPRIPIGLSSRLRVQN